jgi:predicted DNA-binding protein with PD1-like motif
MSLRQRLESLEQTLLPGRFLVLRLDPARDRREQIEAFRAENGVTARDTLVILLSFFTSEELQEAERQSA